MADKAAIDDLRRKIARIESCDSGSFESKSISRETAPSVTGADDADGAFKKIIALVNVRDRSVKQIRTRLEKEGYPSKAIQDAIDRALSYRILDDSRYAETLIRSRINQGKGSAGIERELRGEDIAADSVEGWPYAFETSYDQEFSRALDLLERKPTRAKNKRQASYRKLIQAGFSSRIANDASRAWCDQHDATQRDAVM